MLRVASVRRRRCAGSRLASLLGRIRLSVGGVTPAAVTARRTGGPRGARRSWTPGGTSRSSALWRGTAASRHRPELELRYAVVDRSAEEAVASGGWEGKRNRRAVVCRRHAFRDRGTRPRRHPPR